MPAPSPITKPSRSGQTGGWRVRLVVARRKRAHRGESADASVMQLRRRRQIITSASPRWMILNESPMACALAVQAVAVAEFGPFAP